MHTDLQQTQDGFSYFFPFFLFFFSVSRCVLISPLCMRTRTLVVFDNQNQITSSCSSSLLRNGQTHMSVRKPPPEWNMWCSRLSSFKTNPVRQWPINVLWSSQDHRGSRWTSVFSDNDYKVLEEPRSQTGFWLKQHALADHILPFAYDQVLHNARSAHVCSCSLVSSPHWKC